jgi:hypothetical protein
MRRVKMAGVKFARNENWQFALVVGRIPRVFWMALHNKF